MDKAEGTTENDLSRELVIEVLGWGLAPAVVAADNWFSGVEHLRFLGDQGLSFIKSCYGLKRHLADAIVTNFIQQRTRLPGA